MKKYLMTATAVAALLASAPAHATLVNFDFTFTNAGVSVWGEIDGLTIGGTGPASSVYIYGYTEPAGVPSGAMTAGYPFSTYPYAFPTPLLMTNITMNSFTVDASGVLTTANFYGTAIFDTNNDYVILAMTRALPGEDFAGVYQESFPPGIPHVQSGGDFGNLAYVTATPLPAALPLFATGLGGLGLLGWRRKRKAQAVA
jgi:hypothetical protein